MRYFKLVNNDGEEFSITTKEFFFHDVEGLGFEEDNSFRSVGPVWRLNSSSLSQMPISGQLCLTENGSTTPYQKYDIFRKYITRTPLRFLYYPHGLDGKVYRKKVRVSRLSKTEMTKYGVLDCDISFTPYTPWYEIQTFENVPDAVDDSAHWIWDVGNSWRDSDDVDPETPRYIFGGEARNIIDFDCDSTEKGFIKLTIKGPALNPTWTQYVNGGLKSTGGFATSSNFSLTADEWLTIDNTEGQFSMTVYNRVTGDTRNVYSLRDFDKLCFFNLEEGRNAFAVASQDGIPLSIVVEGHIHYATV